MENMGMDQMKVQGQKIIHTLQLYKIPLVPLLVSTLGEQPLS